MTTPLEEMKSRLNTEITRLRGQPETVNQLTTLGFDATPSTPAEFRTYLRSELAK